MIAKERLGQSRHLLLVDDSELDQGEIGKVRCIFPFLIAVASCSPCGTLVRVLFPLSTSLTTGDR